MFNSTNKPTVLKVAVTATFITALAVAPLAIAQEHEHSADAGASSGKAASVASAVLQINHGVILSGAKSKDPVERPQVMPRDFSTSLGMTAWIARYFLTISAFSIIAMPPRSASLPFNVMFLPQYSAS